MIKLNQTMQYIRCSKYEYLIKKGSISNYSFNLRDEEKNGILEILFEKTKYPMEKDELKSYMIENADFSESSKAEELINQLLEIEVFLKESSQTIPNICLIVDRYNTGFVGDMFLNQGYIHSVFPLENEENSDSICLDWEDDKLKQILSPFDYVVLLKNNYSPSTLHKLNKICLSEKKKVVMSYLDGNEGVIVPLLNVEQTGCYNDFELLRESSFYNLLDYQVMKEKLLHGETVEDPNQNFLHFSTLVNHTLLLLNHYLTFTSMNYFAYSLDFERMVTTKTRLLKFPKCPSCQSDKNLVHAFI